MAGRYKIFEQLGAGGAGTVFKGYDTQLSRYVAIKRLISKADQAKSADDAKAVRKEASALANMKHPHIVQVFDVAEDEEGMFIVMELLEGDDLATLLMRERLGVADFRELAMGTLEALIYAHGQNVLHRDIKPENIKVDRLPGGRFMTRLIDFGLAKLAYTARKQTVDQTGCVLGSVHYMAPEQFRRGLIDGRTDLYALGCVFYQALAGHRPFDASTVTEIMDRHLKHEVVPLHEAVPDLPEPLCDWVMWLMNAEANDRPQSAEAALKWFTENIELAASSEALLMESQAAVPLIPEAPPVIPGAAVQAPIPVATAAQRPVKPNVKAANGPKRSLALPLIAAVIVVIAAAAWVIPGMGWIELFNGKDLTGWSGDPQIWKAEGGVIKGVKAARQRSHLIYQGGTFKDFELEVDFVLFSNNANGGVCFRNKVLDEAKWTLVGYQAEISVTATGSIYEDHGRNMFFTPLPSRLVKLSLNEWHHYRITAKGPAMTLEVDGALVGSYVDDDEMMRRLEGVIGLEWNDSVQYRNVRLKPL